VAARKGQKLEARARRQGARSEGDELETAELAAEAPADID